MTVTRRSLLRGTAAAAVGAGVLGPKALLSPAAAAESLRLAAEGTGRYVGTCLTLTSALSDPAYFAAVVKHCSVIVAENEMKYGALRPLPAPAPISTTAADLLLTLGELNGMRARGHTLVSNTAFPQWFNSVVTPENCGRLMAEHVTSAVTAFRGRVFSWDVVNEPITGDGYYENPWFNRIGPGYIDTAFRLAHEADPACQLVLNDYGFEFTSAFSLTRQATLLRILRGLVERGVPIHAVGLQGHLEAQAMREEFVPAQHRDFLRQIADLGLAIIISELDVDDIKLPTDQRQRDVLIGDCYKRYLEVCFDEPAVEGVVSWGLSDHRSWINAGDREKYRRADGTPQRPALLDGANQPKLASAAAAVALERGRPVRARVR